MRLFRVLGALLPFFFAVTNALTVSDVLAQSLAAYAKRDTASSILSAIENAATCSSCQALLLVLQALAHTGNPNFTNVITSVCKSLGVQDPDVCTGAIGLEGPILAHDLRVMSVGSKTADLFCMTVFGLCQAPAVDTSFSVSMSPKPANARRPTPSTQKPIQVVHISDIHVDLDYTVGASFNCTKNICCRAYTADEAPGVTNTPAGPFGNSACDTRIFTGDVVEGDVWLSSTTEVTTNLKDAYSRMASIGETYAVIGNHDSAPVNSFPPPAVSTDYAPETQISYDDLSANIQQWIGSAAASQVSNNFGSYSTLTSSGLRIISVNTNFWYKANYWLYEKTMEHDPAGLLTWLAGELQAAETAGERVWILGHMPLGAGDAFHDQSYYFDTIIQRFSATIVGVFYGHTHKDEFQIAYSDWSAPSASTATMMSYIAPALTPTSGNPTFRVYDVDPVTFAILDMTVYYADMSLPTFQTSPTWAKLYSVKETYGQQLGVTSGELTPAFWHNVTALFESDDAVFQQYVARKSRDTSGTLAPCTGSCKSDDICQLRAAQSQYNCVTVSPGVHFRRDVAVAHTDDACESSIVAPLMSSVFTTEGIDSLRNALVSTLGAGFLNTTLSQ
ncbi:unnamed protein product [Mycena citricolor]|uniref:Sphingomyelin phosphodiesterase n=1 Tax=Mycena citricolor TaxID=2018698 RepID=A0AAD2Q6E6_9AGAR|nr:unnamed protein product [Mycena citricolor]